MKKKILALCDSETDYLEGMTAFLQKREDSPFELHTYSDTEKLLDFGREEKIEMLLVAESDFTYEVSALPTGRTILLNESGTVQGELRNIDKYQKAERVWQELLDSYAAMLSGDTQLLRREKKAELIGFYSPVRRCLQTSFALTMGQELSRNKKTLYVSFEHYAGWNQLLEKGVRGDLAALLYFGKEQGEKFYCHLQSLTQRIGQLDYIPPAYAGQNLIYVRAAEWQELIEKMAVLGGYDYILLDLSESIQGTFEILNMCDRIFTITGEDRHARAKLAQYEELLQAYSYEEILEKTSRQQLPHFRQLPERIEQYTRSDLAEYIRKLIREELGLCEE